MRVLAVTVEFPPRIGGIASHVAELQKAMNAAGAAYDVLAPVGLRLRGRSRGEGDQPGIVRPSVISGQPFYGWMVRRHVKRLMRRRQIDVLHVHGLRPLPASINLGLPVVFTNHSSGFLARLEKDPRDLAKLAARLHPVTGIIAPSDELARATRSVGYSGPLQVIPNGVDADRFSPGRSPTRNEWGVSDDEVVFLLPRRLVEKNGVIWFAKALCHLGEGPWRAVIAGTGPEEASMRRILSDGGILDKCLFLGAVPQERMPDVYRGADVAVLPSLREATSIAGLEAMATALPVIGTNVGGIPEIVQDKTTGLLVPARDPNAMAAAMRTLLHDRALQACLGEAGRSRVEREFAWQIIAKRTISFMARITSK